MIRLLLAGLVLTGCASIQETSVPDKRMEPQHQNASAFCDLVQAGEELDGQEVWVKGTYWTDGHHFEYIQVQCVTEKAFLDVGRNLSPPQTVARFYQALKEDCERRGQTAICIADGVAVSVTGILRTSADNKRLIDLLAVEEFSFPTKN